MVFPGDPSSGPSWLIPNDYGDPAQQAVHMFASPVESAAIGPTATGLGKDGRRSTFVCFMPPGSRDEPEEGGGLAQEFRQPQATLGGIADFQWQGNQVAGRSTKRQRKQRSSNWTNEETHVLFRCKNEALLAQGRSQSTGGTVAWNKISDNIPGKTAPQCQRRWETLKKSMWNIRAYCHEHNKSYSELQNTDVDNIELATAYDPEWYPYIDKFCNASKRTFRKDVHSTSFQHSPHQQSLEISMENQLSSLPFTTPSQCVQAPQATHHHFQEGQEDTSYSLPGRPEEPLMERQEVLPTMSPSEVCVHASTLQGAPQAIYPHIQEGQEIVGDSIPGGPRACELEGQSSLPICLIPPVCLQIRGATTFLFPGNQKDLPMGCSKFMKWILPDILLCSPWCMEGALFEPRLKELSFWLAIVHGMDPVDIMYNLQVFYAMEENMGKYVPGPFYCLNNPEKYLEYAFHEVQRNIKWHESRLIVFEQHQRMRDICDDMTHHEATEVVHLFRCRHLTKLSLRSFTNLRSLCVEYCCDLRDVSGWENLGNLGWLTWRHSCVAYSFPETRHLTSLQFLELDGKSAYTSTITSPPDLSQCHQLRSLTLKGYPTLVETPDMTNLKHLQTLRINLCDNIRTIHSSLSALSCLGYVDFSECHELVMLPDLRSLRNLRTLRLSHTKICNIPGVELLKQLEELDCRHSKLSSLPDLRDLVFLNWVDTRETGIIDDTFVLCNAKSVLHCKSRSNPHPADYKIAAIPGFDAHPEGTKWILLDMVLWLNLPNKLQKEDVINADVCRWLALIHDRDSEDMMQILQQSSVQYIMRRDYEGEEFLDDFRDPYERFASQEAHQRPGWTGSRWVIRGQRRLQKAFEPDVQHEGLKVLVFIKCEYLTRINLEGLTNLRYLSIVGCNGVEEVSGWANLKNLVVFRWRGAAWRPSLFNAKHLTSLRDLHIHEYSFDEYPRGVHWSMFSSRLSFSIDCIHLCSLDLDVIFSALPHMVVEESPNLTQLKHLQRLRIRGRIWRIHSGLSELTALRHLKIDHGREFRDETELPDLPSLIKLSILQVLDLSETAFESIPGVEKLVNLRILKCRQGRLTSLPDLNHLTFLEEIDVRDTNIKDEASVLCNHNQVRVIVS